MLRTILQPAIAFARKDFFEVLRSPRLITLSIVLGVLLVGSSAALAVVMVNAAKPPNPGAPNPFEVWFQDSSGVLTGIAFGLTPVFLPFLPILAATQVLRKDRERGIFQLFLSKPIPPWGPALGKLAGLYGALAVPTVAISLGVAAAIGVVAGSPVDGGLLAAYVAGNIVLVGLYLLITLLVGSLLQAQIAEPLVVLVWIGFNLLRGTGYLVTARLAALLGADSATTFQVGWTDLATFTGLYQAFLALSVPPSLGFVVSPVPGGGLDFAAYAVPWGLFAWFIGLYVVYALSLVRKPSR